MKKIICDLSPLTMVVLLTLAVGFSSCKSQKAVTQTAASEYMEDTEEEFTLDETPEDEVEEIAPVERKVEPKLTKEQKLSNYFSAIATASSVNAANASINEAVTMFSASDAPLLIVIYKDGKEVGYDEPTTIEKYLHYLKDTKNFNTKVEQVVYDDNGKIKELVLRK